MAKLSFQTKNELKAAIESSNFLQGNDLIQKNKASLSDFLYLIKDGFDVDNTKLLTFVSKTFKPNWHDYLGIMLGVTNNSSYVNSFLDFAKKEKIDLDIKDEEGLSLLGKSAIFISISEAGVGFSNIKLEEKGKKILNALSQLCEGDKEKVNYYFTEILKTDYGMSQIYGASPLELQNFINENNNILNEEISKSLITNSAIIDYLDKGCYKHRKPSSYSYLSEEDISPNLDLISDKYLNKIEEYWKEASGSEIILKIINKSPQLVERLKDQDYDGIAFFEHTLWAGFTLATSRARFYEDEEKNAIRFLDTIPKDSFIFQNMANRFAETATNLLNTLNNLIDSGVKPVIGTVNKQQLSVNFLIGLSGALDWDQEGHKRDKNMIDYVSESNKKILDSFYELFDKVEFTKDLENKKSLKM